MLNTAGLSLDQAPPISIPFGFFVVAPLFAAAAGGVLIWQGDLIFVSRWTPAALAATHLLSLGFLTQVMCGALLQMLPVLAGSPVPRVVLAGRVTQVFLLVGTLALSLGLNQGASFWLILGAVALAISLTLFVLVVGIALMRARGARQTVIAMSGSLIALLVTLLLGIMLVAVVSGGSTLTGLADWVDLHLAWGLLGWAGMLVMGVGYQVVPMFHVTPGFPRWLTRVAAPLVSAGLVVAVGFTLVHRGGLAIIGYGVASATFVVFAVIALDRQRRRARPRIDATLLHWWSAMASVILAAALWVSGGRPELTGVVLLVGVGIGLPSGMLFKIMPFLSWFHLQRRQLAARRFDVRIPHMQVFIPELHAKIQFVCHLIAVGLLMFAAAVPQLGLARPAGFALTLSALALEWLLVRCILHYRHYRGLLG
jgi:hypothetical protein